MLAPKGPRLAPWLDRIYICLNVHLIHAGEIKIDKASISLFCVNKNCMCVCAHILIIMILIYIKLIYDVNIDIIICIYVHSQRFLSDISETCRFSTNCLPLFGLHQL